MTDTHQPSPHQPPPQPCADNPNIATLDRGYRRWRETKGGSADELLELFGDEVEMRTVLTPNLPTPLAGTRRTKAEAKAYFEALAAEWEMIDYEVDRFVGDADDIVMVGRCHWRHRATGGEVDTPKVDVWHFENGKVASFLEMFDSLGFARAIGAIPG